ncbi:MAG: isocitrate/isopropylmalate dehydrogenase family protein, partial [candidate division WOR-3 bacterium]
YPVPEEMFKVKGMERVSRDAAISIKVNTPRGCRRIIDAAFDFARRKKRRKVTCVHKANVVRATDGLFLEIFNEVSQSYPEVQPDEANVDSLCQWLLKRPHDYDVLVAPNLYGDIISDLCAQMTGGLGFGSSGNIGSDYAVFEPTHGSAPKYAGMYKVNPIATVLAAKMMLEWLGETESAEKVERAICRVIEEGNVRTYDMGGDVSSLQMAEAIAAKC